MAERRFHLQFTSSANVSGATAAAQATQQVTRATQQATQATQQHTAATAANTAAQRANVAAARQATAGRQTMRSGAPRPAGATPSRPGALAPASGGRGNAGLAALEVSRAVEDAQYGMAGVLNNIPGLVMMLGGGAGLAGALSLGAVGLTQLIKLIARADEAAGKVDQLVKLRELATDLKEEFDALGETIKGKFTRDLAAARAEAEKELGAWRESIAQGKAGAAREDAQAAGALTKGEATAALNREGEIADGTPANDAAAREAENLRLQRQNAEREQLSRDQERALQNLERGKNGVVSGRGAMAAAERDLKDVPGMRQEWVAAMRQAGLQSDQERIVNDYDLAARERERLQQLAGQAETDLGGIDSALANPLNMTPARAAELALQRRHAAARAESARTKASEANTTVESLSPFVDQAREDMRTGRVTFKGAGERTDLLPFQRAALAQGTAQLSNVDAFEKGAQERLQKAQAEVQAAQASLQEFVAAVDAARTQIEAFETRSAAQNMEAARNAPLDAPLPTLPGQAAMVPPTGPDLPPAPDLSPATGQIDSAMSAVNEQIQRGFDAMAENATKLARGAAGAVARLESRLAAAEGQIEGIRGKLP